MVKSHNLIRKTRQFRIVSLFPHQYPTTIYIQNSMSQTSILLNVKNKMENIKKLWSEIQEDFKLFIVSILIFNNCLSFFV